MPRRAVLHFFIVAWAGICPAILAGCSPKMAAPTPEDTRAAVACEREFVYVDGIIAQRDADASFSRVKLTEARELRNLAVELYLERNYDLALELLAEAVALLKEHQP